MIKVNLKQAHPEEIVIGTMLKEMVQEKLSYGDTSLLKKRPNGSNFRVIKKYEMQSYAAALLLLIAQSTTAKVGVALVQTTFTY